MPKVKPAAKPPQAAKPKLTNRGPAGLLAKVKGGVASPATPPVPTPAPVPPQINKIDPALKSLTVPIDSVLSDPRNARQHPERNMEAIRQSLSRYGQTMPLVARKETRVIYVGNGRLQAARELGWTEIAVNFKEMTDAEAAGYGLADNRSAELAKWDFEMVAALDKLIQEAGDTPIGWTSDELEVLRMADWTPPPISDDGEESYQAGNDGSADEDRLKLTMTEEQRELFDQVIETMRNEQMLEDNEEELTEGSCFQKLCAAYLNKE